MAGTAHQRQSTERSIPVVGTVDSETGVVHIPKSFCDYLDRLEEKLQAEHGKQILVECSKCGKVLVSRERRWTGLCDECAGITRPDERPDLDTLIVPAAVIEEIRHKILESQKIGKDAMPYWTKNPDILDVSIIQRDPQFGDRCYLYQARSHLPHMFVEVDMDYKLVQCSIVL